MSKGHSQSTSVNVDPATQAYVNQLRNYALGQAGLGGSPGSPAQPAQGSQFFNSAFGGLRQNPLYHPAQAAVAPTMGTGANPIYAQGRQLGQQGLAALGGDPTALQGLMGGYSGLLDPYWQQLQQQGLGAIGDQATQAGAYGGSRQGVAEGSFLGQLGMGQAAQRYGEYQNALGRAGQLANLGFGIDPQIIGMLGGALGPYGQTQTTKTQSDPFSQLLGLGLTLFAPGSGLLAGAGGGAASGALPMVI
jgi:hypothetical protein